MATVQISSINYNGQVANITFYPCSGGTIALGSQVIPYIYTSDNYSGQYSLYFSAYNSTCTYDVVCPSSTPTPTVTQTPTNTATQTNTPSTTPAAVTGYSFNLVALPYNFPTSGNSIMNNSGISSGSTDVNVLATGGRGFYLNAIDSDSVNRTNYFSAFTGQSVTITLSQTGNTAIYSGDTNSFKQWIQSPMGNGFVFGAGIGVPPSGTPSGTAVLIQSATTLFTIGLPVYVSLTINGGVTPTPTPTSTVTPTVTQTSTVTATNTPTTTQTPSTTPLYYILAQSSDILTAQNGNGIEYQH